MIVSATFRIFFFHRCLLPVGGHSYQLLLVSSCGSDLPALFAGTINIWKESICTSKCYTQILALTAGKGGSGNLLAQVKRLHVGNWKHADKRLTVSRSLLGKYRIPVYYQLLSQSAAYDSPTALLSAQPKDKAPAATDMHVNKENKYLVGEYCRK